MWQYVCRPKSASAGINGGLGWMPAPFVMHSVAEVAYAACGTTQVNLAFSFLLLL